MISFKKTLPDIVKYKKYQGPECSDRPWTASPGLAPTPLPMGLRGPFQLHLIPSVFALGILQVGLWPACSPAFLPCWLDFPGWPQVFFVTLLLYDDWQLMKSLTGLVPVTSPAVLPCLCPLCLAEGDITLAGVTLISVLQQGRSHSLAVNWEATTHPGRLQELVRFSFNHY